MTARLSWSIMSCYPQTTRPGLGKLLELSRAKAKAQVELSRINDEIGLLDARSCRSELLTVKESLRQAWEANESIGWRGALIDTVVERIDVFPGTGKPFVNVDGVTMRFHKDRVKIMWRKVNCRPDLDAS